MGKEIRSDGLNAPAGPPAVGFDACCSGRPPGGNRAGGRTPPIRSIPAGGWRGAETGSILRDGIRPGEGDGAGSRLADAGAAMGSALERRGEAGLGERSEDMRRSSASSRAFAYAWAVKRAPRRAPLRTSAKRRTACLRSSSWEPNGATRAREKPPISSVPALNTS